VTNTLAYYGAGSITAVNSFVGQKSLDETSGGRNGLAPSTYVSLSPRILRWLIGRLVVVPLRVGGLGHIRGGQGVAHHVAGRGVLAGLPGRLVLEERNQLHADLKLIGLC
jgi:hypothetical protein